MGKVIMKGSIFGIGPRDSRPVSFDNLVYYNTMVQDEFDNILDKIKNIEEHLATIDARLDILEYKEEEEEIVLVADDDDDVSEFKIMLKGEYYNE